MLTTLLRRSQHVLFRRPRRGVVRPVRDGRAFAASAAVGGPGPDVAVQLDYYMSLQFAGVAVALVNGACVWAFRFDKIAAGAVAILISLSEGRKHQTKKHFCGNMFGCGWVRLWLFGRSCERPSPADVVREKIPAFVCRQLARLP